jgi:hypothetical protein
MSSKMSASKQIKTILCLPMILLLIGCGRKDDTRLIRELIDSSARLAEAHRIGDLMEGATTGFLALPANYNRRTTRGILYRVFKFYGDFKIRYPQPIIRLDKHSGTAKSTIHFILVRQDMDLPALKDLVNAPQLWLKAARQKADIYQLKLDLIKSNKHWLVEKAYIQGSRGVGI